MNTKTITLTVAQWREILDASEAYRDEGPEGEGWQSPELSGASVALGHALAEEKDA